MSLVICALPWLGLVSYAFVIPGWDVPLPRLHQLLGPRALYELVGPPSPFHALVQPLNHLVYFEGEGVLP